LIKSIREADDLARVSFNAALERYIQGSSDCVFHAAFSVEMALTLRLDKSLNAEEKEEIRKKNGLMLSGAVKLASKKGILKKPDAEKAWRLNHLRNMSAHPSNWVAFIKQQYRAVFNMEKEMPDVHSFMEELRKTVILHKDENAFREDLSRILTTASDYLKRVENLPNLDWCASQDTLRFQKKMAKEYYEEVSKKLLTTKGVKELLENAANNVAYMQTTYAFTGRAEYEALNCAYDILKRLGVV
jgi:hypothetical protein